MSLNYSKCLLRLSDLERQKLQLVVAALKVSEYTDDVDDFRHVHNSERRMVTAMREFFDTVTGLALASDAVPRSVKEVLRAGDRHLSAVVPLLEELFEIMRRHKRLNPTNHHGEYGKLIMLLQDVQRRSVQSALGIQSNLIIPLKTVGAALQAVGAESLLCDAALGTSYLQCTGQAKADGLQALLDRHDQASSERRAVLDLCLRSIDDVRQLLLANTAPLAYLRDVIAREFRPMSGTDRYNIAIACGRGEARFTHSHETQCQYVTESLLLWEKVQLAIFDIWDAAEEDMLVDSGGRYDFCNTGQGFHRMCRAPKSYNLMAQCVRETEKEMGGWVGIKVIHLGDRDVPNPLVFIDKYTLIPRIVQPVVQTVLALRYMLLDGTATQSMEDRGAYKTYPGIDHFLQRKYTSYAELRLRILADFFRHGFDGSGDDGGSCIDGRLTSAWNWCHQLHKKAYYDAFVLTGFSGFD